jgi:hypothetical protein
MSLEKFSIMTNLPMLTEIVARPIAKMMARLIFSRRVGSFTALMSGNGNTRSTRMKSVLVILLFSRD